MFENRPQRLKHIVNSRWFPALDLVCASAASLVWFLRPQANWWPLLLALLPWFIRLASGYFPFERTPFDLPLLFFLISAGLGVWVSYDTPGALGKFWVILGSIFLYYALAAQPKPNLVFVTGVLSILGLVVAVSVFFDPTLQEYTADLGIIQRSIDWWGAVRPAWQINALSPNVSGGILAMLLPFPLFGMFYKGKGKGTVSIAALISTVLVVAALIFTSSRGAWVALVVAAGVLILITMLRPVIRRLTPTRQAILAATLLTGTFLVTGYIIINSREIAKVMDLLPGFPFGISRLDLFNNTWNLLADFPFTGAGLRAFPGLYSEYILHIPYLFLEYSHHLYMDIALEQGAVGLFSFVGVLFGSLLIGGALVLKNEESGQAFYMQLAVIFGLVVMIIHGLIDNPLYGMHGTPLLFLVPGIGAVLYKKNIPSPVELNEKVGILKFRPLRGSLLFGLFLLIFMGQSFEKAVSAAWIANLGSIYMSKAELANFPSNSFDVLPDREPYLKAREYFHKALDKYPMNITANYRLGLISSNDLDFATAIPYFERAYEGNSGHRGIQKALGYNYVWTDRPEAAAELLAEIPEARYELEVYVWWWETQGRPDLAAKSQTALGYLNAD